MRTAFLTALGATAALALTPGAASAGTVTLDQPCYLVGVGQQGTVTLAGFTPSVEVRLDNDQLGSTTVTTDATGAATLGFTVGDASFAKPGTKPFDVVATETANPASTGTASSLVTPFAFANSGGRKSPNAKRNWFFSGFAPGGTIYGHFLYKNRPRGTYKFGKAAAPCGTLKVRAAGIPVSGSIGAGTYKVQIDQVKAFKKTTKPRLTAKTVVYTTFRARAASAADLALLGAGLGTTTAAGAWS